MHLTLNQDHALLYAGLGLVVVVLTSFLKSVNFTPKQSHFLTVVVSILTGAVSTYFAKNGTDALFSVTKVSTAVYAASQLIYGFALQNSTVDAWLTKFNILPSNK
jgi:hypothetical protein